MLLDGDIDPRRFIEAVYNDSEIVGLSEKINIHGDGNPDKNALGPQSMSVTLKGGSVFELTCSDPLGSPKNPLNETQRNSKVNKCFELGLPQHDVDAFIAQCDGLAALKNCRDLLTLVS